MVNVGVDEDWLLVVESMIKLQINYKKNKLALNERTNERTENLSTTMVEKIIIDRVMY